MQEEDYITWTKHVRRSLDKGLNIALNKLRTKKPTKIDVNDILIAFLVNKYYSI
jgi:hypothetical protein